jgi:hypothetical protein
MRFILRGYGFDANAAVSSMQQLTGKCLINAVISMDRRNTKLVPLALKTKAKIAR